MYCFLEGICKANLKNITCNVADIGCILQMSFEMVSMYLLRQRLTSRL